jgi:hypothetical protein
MFHNTILREDDLEAALANMTAAVGGVPWLRNRNKASNGRTQSPMDGGQGRDTRRRSLKELPSARPLPHRLSSSSPGAFAHGSAVVDRYGMAYVLF